MNENVKLVLGDQPSKGKTGKPQISSVAQVKDGKLKGQMWDLFKRIVNGEQGLVDKAEQHFDLTEAERHILRIIEEQVKSNGVE